MDRFYKLLRTYNAGILRYHRGVPGWALMYLLDRPPNYWQVMIEVLRDVPRDYLVVEIGAGVGDVSALLLYLGFEHLIALEREPDLASIAHEKLSTLFGRSDIVLPESYPIRLVQRPNVLIQVNCVYADDAVDKEQYLDRAVRWHTFNGTPEIFLMEVVDASFTHNHLAFPEHVRLSESDVRRRFSDYSVSSYWTYVYPRNSATKKLYVIKGEYKVRPQI